MIQTDTKYYSKQIAARYPNLDANGVQKLCLFFSLQLFGYIKSGHEVVLANRHTKTKVKILKRNFDVENANKKAGRLKYRRDKLRKERHEAKISKQVQRGTPRGSGSV